MLAAWHATGDSKMTRKLNQHEKSRFVPDQCEILSMTTAVVCMVSMDLDA
jgi:hypothetical protein